MGRTIIWVTTGIILLFSNCDYRKGNAFTYSGTSDTLEFFILTKGSGRNISRKISNISIKHMVKNDECRIIYVSDSGSIAHQRSILLFNSVLPEMKDDMLSKGMMGAFGTKQIVTYLAVTREDFERYFKMSVEKQK